MRIDAVELHLVVHCRIGSLEKIYRLQYKRG